MLHFVSRFCRYSCSPRLGVPKALAVVPDSRTMSVRLHPSQLPSANATVHDSSRGVAKSQDAHNGPFVLKLQGTQLPRRMFVVGLTFTTHFSQLLQHNASAKTSLCDKPSEAAAPEVSANVEKLPEPFVKSISSAISALKDSLEVDESTSGSEFRNKANKAKEAIRDYIKQWRGRTPSSAQVCSDWHYLSSPLHTVCCLICLPTQKTEETWECAGYATAYPVSLCILSLHVGLPLTCSLLQVNWRASSRPSLAFTLPMVLEQLSHPTSRRSSCLT